MKKSQQGSVAIILIVVGILITISVGVFFTVQSGVFRKNNVLPENNLVTNTQLETSLAPSTSTISTKTTNPIACNRTDYAMAFILIAQNQSQVTPAKVNKLTAIKDAFAKDFSTATNALAKMDTSYQVVTIVDDGTLIQDNGPSLSDKVVKKFYEKNPDNFDFVSIYPAFNDSNNGAEYHNNVKNNLVGIYSGTRGYIFDKTAQYGSKGRLLGINLMPNIDNIPSPENGIAGSGTGGLLHETGHQWCCSVGDDFTRGENGAKLEIMQQGIHFYQGLASPNKTGDPMFANNWILNGDGTYSRDNQPGFQVYHPFQLYFMGLLSTSEYSKKYAVYDAGIVGKDFNDKNAKFYKEVSVDDIIKVAGERKCVSS